MMNYDKLFRSTLSMRPGERIHDYYCTTCGGQFAKIRSSLKNADKSELYDYLISLHFSDFSSHRREDNKRLYIEHLLILSNIFSAPEIENIIDQWLREIPADEKREFYEFMVFYFLRSNLLTRGIFDKYVEKCLQYVNAHHYTTSLIETLVLVLKNSCPENVVSIAVEISKSDKQMQRVLLNVYGHNFLRSVINQKD